MKQYTKTHEWLEQVDGCPGEYLSGLTEYAVEQLGGINYIEFREMDEFAPGDVIADIESAKTVDSLNAPCTCKVLAVNDAQPLEDTVSVLPEKTWICRIKVHGENDTVTLLSGGEYLEYIKTL